MSSEYVKNTEIHSNDASNSPLALFSFLPRRTFFFLTIPAILASIVAGGIAPYMTAVVGNSFDAFSRFPLSNPSHQDVSRLLHGVGSAALQLIALAAGALILSSITSALWIWTGESNVRAVTTHVYASVTTKEMTWFDDNDRSTSPAGLMASFSRESEDIRAASSLASGFIIQHLTTTITALILAFTRSWALTLTILASLPALTLIQAFSQSFGNPLLASERALLASAASALDRTLSAMPTIKAFNAQPQSLSRLQKPLYALSPVVRKLNSLWAIAAGLAQFASMAMFVQAFWFGAKLVRNRSLSPGDVMAVFWACLIATSNLQMSIPHAIVLAKGLASFSALLALTASDSDPDPDPKNKKPKTKTMKIRGIQPSHPCRGELSLHNVSFTYPSRPTQPVLSNLSLFLPARETTFIVGGSGSGKSTLARLLTRTYAPQAGTILLDDVDCAFAERAWVSENVLCVGGGEAPIVDGSVHDNVVLAARDSGSGRGPGTSREEVVGACRAALMHGFVVDLPEGYDTRLGADGVVLSGGQRQRLAIARAWLRDPTVLILDEATSALDGTSRVLVFEALKRWRANKTTVVITHDLSQISPGDFVYVLGDGRVVEQGYRSDLQEARGGVFREMVRVQAGTGGCLPEKDEKKAGVKEGAEVSQEVDEGRKKRPVTWGNWLVETVPDLASVAAQVTTTTTTTTMTTTTKMAAKMIETLPPIKTTAALRPPPRAHVPHAPSVISQAFSYYSPSMIASSDALSHVDLGFDADKKALERSASEASRRRIADSPRGRRGVLAPINDTAPVKDAKKQKKRVQVTVVESTTPNGGGGGGGEEDRVPGLLALLRVVYPTIPRKPVLGLGLVLCMLNGAMTPLFSFLLAKLIFAVSAGGVLGTAARVNVAGGTVLAVAAVDGVLLGAKHVVMENVALGWVQGLRCAAFGKVLCQDQKWFDREGNGGSRVVQVIVKDGDEAGALVAVVIGQLSVVGAMLGVGMVWALVLGWQLALVGFAIGPVFACAMAFQAGVVERCQMRAKRATEEVAKRYYETLTNIRGIRFMALEAVFRARFDDAAARAHSAGVRGAFVEGCTHGIANALIYVAEAMLFYVGAVLVSRGTYSYLQMVQVLNLVVFTVTIGSQMLACTQKIAKAKQATWDLYRLVNLSTKTDESKGKETPPMRGALTFKNVTFAYPGRADVPVLKDVSFRIGEGECVAIVGPSGSGKSTIGALVQRLYEPDAGRIMLGDVELGGVSVRLLREHVAVVSQRGELFEGSVRENIAFGSGEGMSDGEVWSAGRAAGVDEVLTGYGESVGEKGEKVSLGQGQRIVIARALARRGARVFVFDECTSALDGASEKVVLESVVKGERWGGRKGRGRMPMRILITHKMKVMRECDRVLVIDGGRIVEEGKYEELMRRRGVFWGLANAGEWQGDS